QAGLNLKVHQINTRFTVLDKYKVPQSADLDFVTVLVTFSMLFMFNWTSVVNVNSIENVTNTCRKLIVKHRVKSDDEMMNIAYIIAKESLMRFEILVGQICPIQFQCNAIEFSDRNILLSEGEL
ncbi:hypothetical protein L9F63_023524, partial [Diploptera punctata]